MTMGRRVAMIPVLAILATALAVAGLIASEAIAGGAPADCSAGNADGGAQVTWAEIEGATEYVYRLEIAGEHDQFARIDGTSTLVSLPEDVRGTFFVSAVFADGSYSPAVSCGSATANPGTGQQGASCNAVDTDGGVAVTWNPIADAASYVYRLEVPGQDDQFAEVLDASVLIALAEDVVGTVFLSAKFADGSYSPAISCGSGKANPGSGQQGAECSIETVEGAVQFRWSAVDGATSYVYRYEIEGQPNRFGESLVTPQLSAFIDDGPEGTEVFVAISAKFADGTYSPAVDCGTAEIGGTRGGTVFPKGPAECSIIEVAGDGSTGIKVDWGKVLTRNLNENETAQYRLLFLISNEGYFFSQPVDFPTQEFSSPIAIDRPIDDPDGTLWDLYNGDTVTVSVRATIWTTTENSNIPTDGEATDCGSLTIENGIDPGGEAEGPSSCTIDGDTVGFSNPFDQLIRIQTIGFRTPVRYYFAGGTTSFDIEGLSDKRSPRAGKLSVSVQRIDDFDILSAPTQCIRVENGG